MPSQLSQILHNSMGNDDEEDRELYKLNNINLFVGFSATSKNLVKTTTGDLGGQQDTFTHIYTFDSQNRVLSETASDNIGNTVMKTYTYY